jgi:hypothetical protein
MQALWDVLMRKQTVGGNNTRRVRNEIIHGKA